MTEEEARRERGDGKAAVAVRRAKDVDRAARDGASDGLHRNCAQEEGRYKILGAAIVSPAAGEMIADIGVATKTGPTFDMPAFVMHTYPACSFALRAMAAEVYYDKLLQSKGLFSALKKIGLQVACGKTSSTDRANS